MLSAQIFITHYYFFPLNNYILTTIQANFKSLSIPSASETFTQCLLESTREKKKSIKSIARIKNTYHLEEGEEKQNCSQLQNSPSRVVSAWLIFVGEFHKRQECRAAFNKSQLAVIFPPH